MHTYKPVNGSNLSLFSAQFLDAFLDLKKTELMSGKKKKKKIHPWCKLVWLETKLFRLSSQLKLDFKSELFQMNLAVRGVHTGDHMKKRAEKRKQVVLPDQRRRSEKCGGSSHDQIPSQCRERLPAAVWTPDCSPVPSPRHTVCGSTLKARLGKRCWRCLRLPSFPPRGARNSSHRHPFAEHII